jgi:hypothetical protein
MRSICKRLCPGRGRRVNIAYERRRGWRRQHGRDVAGTVIESASGVVNAVSRQHRQLCRRKHRRY